MANYSCSECNYTTKQWKGQCAQCFAWNTLSEMQSAKHSSWVGVVAKPTLAKDVDIKALPRIMTYSREFNRALGGGLVPGSVILIGGDPGVGKSTLLLQTICHLSQSEQVLYTSGEEALSQIVRRANRIQVNSDQLVLLAETSCQKILEHTTKQKAKYLVLDSIQTLYDEQLSQAPGSVSQVRASAMAAVQYAKQNHVTIFLIGHVTKDGALAGPRVLEHMVDTVLYLEGESDGRYRILRAVKNRFGAVNEIGMFGMTANGLKDLSSPSAIFLSQSNLDTPGRAVIATWEGSRPILIEIQALLDQSAQGQPRRLTVGLDSPRVAMILAIISRHLGLAMHSYDVFINVVGGIKLTETAADLAVLLSLISSLKGKALPQKMMVIGEIGLGGEVRPVPQGQERIKEAIKHGFTTIVAPKANASSPSDNIKYIYVEHVKEAVAALL